MKNNVKISISEIKLQEVKIEFPLYSYIIEDETEIYTKISLNSFFQIKRDWTKFEINIIKGKNKIISSIFYNNQCTQKKYEEILNEIKSILKK